MNTQAKKPLVLFILDGWGHSDSTEHNPCHQAKTPYIDQLFHDHPHRLIQASGEHVGLPDGQIGNSEVGHLHLGAGRLVHQDLSRISHAFTSGSIHSNHCLNHIIKQAQQTGARIHLLGLVSPGGVHSHEEHILAMIRLLAKQHVECYLHAFLDGRDVAPRSAQNSLERCQKTFAETKNGAIATICGRYYAMDRDQRWDRVALAYNAITAGKADYHATTAVAALAQAYERNENDEFVAPTIIDEHDGITRDGDIVLFMNFRADRARQLSQALTQRNFSGFERDKTVKLSAFATLTHYSKDLPAEILFPAQTITNTLGEVLATQGLTQLRLAETEKYAHVTYFFNGGNEAPLTGEDRIMVNSPSVATYDLQPEMSAIELTDRLVESIQSQQYDVIICNYANPDMVGHTGFEQAANEAMVTIDTCLRRALKALAQVQGQALITADHGNIECMFNEQTGQPHTAHTTNQVPLVYIGQRHCQFDQQPAALYDIAPTILLLLGITPPSEMTGRGLLHC